MNLDLEFYHGLPVTKFKNVTISDDQAARLGFRRGHRSFLVLVWKQGRQRLVVMIDDPATGRSWRWSGLMPTNRTWRRLSLMNGTTSPWTCQIRRSS